MNQIIGAATPRSVAEDRQFDPLCVVPVPEKIRKTNPRPEKWNPAQLPRKMQRLIHAMAYGVDKTLFPTSDRPIPPGVPLSVRQAALALGLRQRQCDRWSLTPIFREIMKNEILTRRHFEEPENIAVAICIRDNPETFPRDRIAAIAALRVREPASAVRVEVTQQTLLGGGKIAAGYVVKIGAGAAGKAADGVRAVGKDYRG